MLEAELSWLFADGILQRRERGALDGRERRHSESVPSRPYGDGDGRPRPSSSALSYSAPSDAPRDDEHDSNSAEESSDTGSSHPAALVK